MHKAKVLVIGPCESGKTHLCNYLADATESTGGDYRPTKGVRILEFECDGENPTTGDYVRADVELWDCSGDKRYENCWPCMWQDAQGVVLVYNPERQQQERDLEHWHHMFVAQQGLSSDHCLLIASCQPLGGGAEITAQYAKPSSRRFEGVKWAAVNLQENPEILRGEFSSFVSHIIATSHDRQAHEEEVIVTNRT